MTGAVLVLRVVLGGVFLISATGKLVAPGTFTRNVVRYRVLPDRLAKLYGWSLPYLELAAALTLLLGWQVKWGALGIILMLSTFAVAVSVVMARHQNLSCSCFGLLYSERVGWHTLVRDALLALMGVLILVLEDGTVSIVTSVTDGFTPVTAVALAAAILMIIASVLLALLTKTGYLFGRRLPRPGRSGDG